MHGRSSSVDRCRVERKVLHVLLNLADAVVKYSPFLWSDTEAFGDSGFVANSEHASAVDLVQPKEYEQTQQDEHRISHKHGWSPRIYEAVRCWPGRIVVVITSNVVFEVVVVGAIGTFRLESPAIRSPPTKEAFLHRRLGLGTID